MVDLFRMFRGRNRGPAPGRQGFARSRQDVTSIGERMGDIFRSVVGEKPPVSAPRQPSRESAPVRREAAIAAVSHEPLPDVYEPSDFAHDEPPIPRAVQREPAAAARREQPLRTEAPRTRTSSPATAPRTAHAGYLAIHGVEKSFGTRKIVHGVSIYVRRGEAVGILGPNGAGKTTVFYMITGLIKPDRGRVELDGHDVTQLPMYQRARLGIGYLPQETSIFRGLSVEDNIRAVLEVVEPDKRKRERELDSLLEEFNVTRLRKSPSIALSGGERRRVEIARALASRPS